MEGLKANWSAVEDDVVSSQDRLSEKMTRAEACRSSSDDEHSGEGRPSMFWVKTLKRATESLGYNTPKKVAGRQPVKVMSGCTGMGAEGFVLQAGLGQGLKTPG